MTDPHDPAAGPGATPRYEEFVRLFVAHEARLRAFLRALLPAWADVDEVMQETSLVAWRKFARFDTNTSFAAWACTIARYEALAYLRDRSREPLVFSPALTDLIAAEGGAETDALEHERRALDHCLAKLGAPERELLLVSYRPGARFHEVATRSGRSVAGYYKTLQRLRARLHECIRFHLKQETA